MNFRDLFDSKIENNLNKMINGDPEFKVDAVSQWSENVL